MIEETRRQLKVLVLDDVPSKREAIKRDLGAAGSWVEWIEVGRVEEALSQLLGVSDVKATLSNFRSAKFSRTHDVDLFFLDWDLSGSAIPCPFPTFQGFAIALVADSMFSRLEQGEASVIALYSARSADIESAPEAAFLIVALSSRETRSVGESTRFTFLGSTPQKPDVRECFKTKTKQLLALLPPSELFALAEKIETARDAQSSMPLEHPIQFTTGEKMDVKGLFTYIAAERDFVTSLELIHSALLNNTLLGNYEWYLHVFDVLVHGERGNLANPACSRWQEFFNRNADRNWRERTDPYLVDEIQKIVEEAQTSCNGILGPLNASSPNNAVIRLHHLARAALIQNDKNWGIFEVLQEQFGSCVTKPSPSSLGFYVARKRFQEALKTLSGQGINPTEVTVESRLVDREIRDPTNWILVKVGDCGIWFRLCKGFFRRNELKEMGGGGWGTAVVHIRRFGEMMCLFRDEQGECMWDMLSKCDVSVRLGECQPYRSQLDAADFLCVRIPGLTMRL